MNDVMSEKVIKSNCISCGVEFLTYKEINKCYKCYEIKTISLVEKTINLKLPKMKKEYLFYFNNQPLLVKIVDEIQGNKEAIGCVLPSANILWLHKDNLTLENITHELTHYYLEKEAFIDRFLSIYKKRKNKEMLAIIVSDKLIKITKNSQVIYNKICNEKSD